MKGKFQKVDCCSNGGEAGGWSAKRKDRMQCEPCKTTVVGIQQNSFVSFYSGLETQLDYQKLTQRRELTLNTLECIVKLFSHHASKPQR